MAAMKPWYSGGLPFKHNYLTVFYAAARILTHIIAAKVRKVLRLFSNVFAAGDRDQINA